MILRNRRSISLAGTLMLLALSLATPLTGFATPAAPSKPTVVLVHGAFADSSSWNGVIDRLHADGYRVIAAPNELRIP